MSLILSKFFFIRIILVFYIKIKFDFYDFYEHSMYLLCYGLLSH